MRTTLYCQYRLQSFVFLTLSAGGVPRDFFNEKSVPWPKNVWITLAYTVQSQHCIRRRHHPSYLQRTQLELLCPCRTKGCLCYTLLNVDQPDQQFRKIMGNKKNTNKISNPTHPHSHRQQNINTQYTKGLQQPFGRRETHICPYVQ